MIRKGIQSQIATIIVFIMAVMFLFVLMSLNIGKIAQKKTAIDNVADSTGLNLASELGSMANAYKHQFKIYGASLTGNCELNWKLILGGLLILAAAIATIVTGGLSLTIAGVLLSGALLTTQGMTIWYMANNPVAVSALKLKFKNLSTLQQIIETPIQSVLFATNEDPGWVTDVYDMDNDNDHTDRIPRFLKWYNLRLDTFPAVGPIVDGFLTSFFRDATGQERFFKDLDANWMVKPGEESIRWQIDYDGVIGRELKIAPWLKDELTGLRGLLSTLRQYGYGINVSIDPTGKIIGIVDSPERLILVGPGLFFGVGKYEEGAIDNMVGEIEEFENIIARGLTDIDRDTAVQGLEAWAPLLKNDSADHWYNRLENLESQIVALRDKLIERRNQIHSCMANCSRQAYDCCQYCTFSYCCGTDADGNCTGTCSATYCCSYGCCGVMLNCGVLCDDAHCKPTYSCPTPLPAPLGSGNSIWCCNVRPLEQAGCWNNKIENWNGRNAIFVLQGIINEINQVQALINSFSNQIKDAQARTYDMAHEAFYLWQDYLGGTSSARQKVNHIVYARIEDLNPRPSSQGGDGFELPHIDSKSSWKWGFIPQVCVTVDRGSGTFRLTVARFDENPVGTGLLDRFWSLLFSKGALTAAEKVLVNQIAARYQSDLAQNKYYEVGGLPIVSSLTKALLRNIIDSRGIVTKIKVNYGPGETQENQSSVSAARRNRDIYIINASSDMNMR